MIGRTQWIDAAGLQSFVLSCQDEDNGGIADRPGDMADVFHTFFGVASKQSSTLCRPSLTPSIQTHTHTVLQACLCLDIQSCYPLIHRSRSVQRLCIDWESRPVVRTMARPLLLPLLPPRCLLCRLLPFRRVRRESEGIIAAGNYGHYKVLLLLDQHASAQTNISDRSCGLFLQACQ